MNAAWHFVGHQRGQVVINSNSGEHFPSGDDNWRPGEALVRECVQNSIDARHDNSLVRVDFQVRGDNSMSAETADFWFSSLWGHLRSKDCNLTDIDRAPPSGRFVVVEDFGTHGLEGDIQQGGLSNSSNRFFNFFRAQGLSGNTLNGNTGGSWGVGKTVFNRCSNINSLLALSGRRGEGDAVLIGTSELRHHRTEDGEFHALGQFGVKDQPDPCLVLPDQDQSIIRRFISDFGLTRSIAGSDAEPGLSVVMPYADPLITAGGIAEIVVRQFFHPINQSRLRVRVSGEIDGTHREIDLNQENLLEFAARLGDGRVERVLELDRWLLAEGQRQVYELKECDPGRAPAWDDGLLRKEDPAFSELCTRFERGERVAIRVPIHVRGKGAVPTRASFIVCLQRDLTGSGYRPVFVRGFTVVPNARQRAIRYQSLFCLVMIEEGPLAEMLRLAEPPAHTFWTHETANFRGRYEHGRQTIDLVVNAPKFLADALSNARTGRDLDVWADLFPLPASEGDRGDQGTRRKGNKQPKPGPVKPPVPRPKPFKIDQIAGGFTVARDCADITPLPEALEVLVAYDTSRGNPFKKYHPADFNLAELTRIQHGIEHVHLSDNRLECRPTSEEFQLKITGFDVNRDVVVRVRTIEANKGGDS